MPAGVSAPLPMVSAEKGSSSAEVAPEEPPVAEALAVAAGAFVVVVGTFVVAVAASVVVAGAFVVVADTIVVVAGTIAVVVGTTFVDSCVGALLVSPSTGRCVHMDWTAATLHVPHQRRTSSAELQSTSAMTELLESEENCLAFVATS